MQDEKAPGLKSKEPGVGEENSAHIKLYNPRAGTPPKAHPNHFRFPISKTYTLFQEMVAILRLAEAELITAM